MPLSTTLPQTFSSFASTSHGCYSEDWTDWVMDEQSGGQWYFTKLIICLLKKLSVHPHLDYPRLDHNVVWTNVIWPDPIPDSPTDASSFCPVAFEVKFLCCFVEAYYCWATVHSANSLPSHDAPKLVAFSRANNVSGSPMVNGLAGYHCPQLFNTSVTAASHHPP